MYFFILLTNAFNLVVQPGPLIHLCKRWLKISMTSLFEKSKPLRMKSRKVQSTIQCNLSVRLWLTNLTSSTIHFLSTKNMFPPPTSYLCDKDLRRFIISHHKQHIFNQSLSIGEFPSPLKLQHVRPRLKKVNLDKEILNNYRSVANIPFLCKVIRELLSAVVGS